MERANELSLLLVSVIIPCRDRVDWLRECLESVAGQCYQNIEVIVVDDASEDDIPAVVSSIAWPFEIPPRYIRLDKNRGPGGAREAGRQAARGEFISYLDSDDLWHEDKVRDQVQALLAHPWAGMCYCTAREFKALPLTGDERVHSESDQAFSSFLPHILHSRRPWGTGACMWTRRATDLIGPWFQGWVWEDYEYDCRAGCHDIGIVFVPKVLCYYRRDNEGAHLSSGRGVEKERQRMQAIFEISRNLEKHGKLREEVLASLLLRLIYSKALALYALEEEKLASEGMHEVRRLSTWSSRINIYAALVLLARFVLSPSKVAGLGRRLRRFLPDRRIQAS